MPILASMILFLVVIFVVFLVIGRNGLFVKIADSWQKFFSPFDEDNQKDKGEFKDED